MACAASGKPRSPWLPAWRSAWGCTRTPLRPWRRPGKSRCAASHLASACSCLTLPAPRAVPPQLEPACPPRLPRLRQQRALSCEHAMPRPARPSSVMPSRLEAVVGCRRTACLGLARCSSVCHMANPVQGSFSASMHAVPAAEHTVVHEAGRAAHTCKPPHQVISRHPQSSRSGGLPGSHQAHFWRGLRGGGACGLQRTAGEVCLLLLICATSRLGKTQCPAEA